MSALAVIKAAAAAVGCVGGLAIVYDFKEKFLAKVDSAVSIVEEISHAASDFKEKFHTIMSSAVAVACEASDSLKDEAHQMVSIAGHASKGFEETSANIILVLQDSANKFNGTVEGSADKFNGLVEGFSDNATTTMQVLCLTLSAIGAIAMATGSGKKPKPPEKLAVHVYGGAIAAFGAVAVGSLIYLRKR